MNNAIVLNLPTLIFKKSVLKIKFSSKFFWILSFVLVIIILVSHIIQINSLARETYQIQEYQKKIGDLNQENGILLFNALELSSLSSIETTIKDFGFEKTQKVHYIQALERQVVAK